MLQHHMANSLKKHQFQICLICAVLVLIAACCTQGSFNSRFERRFAFVFSVCLLCKHDVMHCQFSYFHPPPQSSSGDCLYLAFTQHLSREIAMPYVCKTVTLNKQAGY